MLHKITAFILAAGLLGGCIFVERHPHGQAAKRECGPAHHWENGYCVHNGHGHGNDDHGHGNGNGHGHD